MDPKEAFFKINLDSLKEELTADRGKPDAYWNDINLLNSYMSFVYDNTRLTASGVSVPLTAHRKYVVTRAEILYQEILYRMGNK